MRAHAKDFRAEVENDFSIDGEDADILTHRIASDWRKADLDPANQALCRFAGQLTIAPTKMSESHILDLRDHGFSDAAIHDASQVISYFNYINRIADSLNVDLENDVHTWELSTPD